MNLTCKIVPSYNLNQTRLIACFRLHHLPRKWPTRSGFTNLYLELTCFFIDLFVFFLGVDNAFRKDIDMDENESGVQVNLFKNQTILKTFEFSRQNKFAYFAIRTKNVTRNGLPCFSPIVLFKLSWVIKGWWHWFG